MRRKLGDHATDISRYDPIERLPMMSKELEHGLIFLARFPPAVGEAPKAKDIDATELAAWTSVSRTILNLHESITRN
jgi:hypothetical protein